MSAGLVLASSSIIIPKPPIPPIPLPEPPQALHVKGPLFYTEDGKPYRLQLVTAFRAPERWLTGENLDPFVAWTRSVGAHGWRVFLQHAYLNSWPPDWPAQPWMMPLEQIRPFVEWCNMRGFYVELTVLCDCQAFNQDLEVQVRRVEDVLMAVRDCPNVLFSIGNEPSENGFEPVAIANALHLAAGDQPLMSLGLYPITGHEPDFPVLDYVGDHQARKSDWYCESGKVGRYQYEQTGVPSFAEEPPKFSAPAGEAGYDPEATECSWDTSPAHAEDAGGGYGLSSAGVLFHCSSGIATVVPSELETVCARRTFYASSWFDPIAPTWTYTHDGLPDCPLEHSEQLCEAVARISPDGAQAFVAAAGVTPDWVPVPQNGWTIIGQGGTRGELLRLTR